MNRTASSTGARAKKATVMNDTEVYKSTTASMNKLFAKSFDYTGMKKAGGGKLNAALASATSYSTPKKKPAQSKGHYAKAIKPKGLTRYI